LKFFTVIETDDNEDYLVGVNKILLAEEATKYFSHFDKVMQHGLKQVKSFSYALRVLTDYETDALGLDTQVMYQIEKFHDVGDYFRSAGYGTYFSPKCPGVYTVHAQLKFKSGETSSNAWTDARLELWKNNQYYSTLAQVNNPPVNAQIPLFINGTDAIWFNGVDDSCTIHFAHNSLNTTIEWTGVASFIFETNRTRERS
jgi:hypothetical protein